MVYKKSELNPAVQRFIKSKEKYLERTCRKIWSGTNKQGEKYLFGNFCKDYDKVIVSIAIFNVDANGGWLPLWRS